MRTLSVPIGGNRTFPLQRSTLLALVLFLVFAFIIINTGPSSNEVDYFNDLQGRSGRGGAGGLDDLRLNPLRGESRGNYGSGSEPHSQAAAEEGPSHVDFKIHGIPLTDHVAGTNGYQVFDNLYIHDGHYVAITSQESLDGLSGSSSSSSDDGDDTGDDNYDDDGRRVSHRTKSNKAMTRKMAPIPAESEIVGKGDIRFKTIDSEEAELEFGRTVVGRLPGTTIIFNDRPGASGFMIYHTNFVSECFSGAIKALAAAPSSSSSSQSHSGIQLPSRILFPKCNDFEGWSDDRALTTTLLTTLFPSANIEEEGAWRARVKSGVPVVLDRVVIVDRPAAHTGKGDVDKWGKMFGNVAKLVTPVDFFDPIRFAMMRGLGIRPSDVNSHINSKSNINDDNDNDSYSVKEGKSKPVVTYMDQQGEGRRLLKTDHEALVKALKGLTDIAEIHIARPKQMSVKERTELLAKTTILISVHNENLMYQMWMENSDTSTVMEIFDAGGYAREFPE